MIYNNNDIMCILTQMFRFDHAGRDNVIGEHLYLHMELAPYTHFTTNTAYYVGGCDKKYIY